MCYNILSTSNNKVFTFPICSQIINYTKLLKLKSDQ